MRAIVVTEFGGPDVLSLTEVETPRPAHGEVTIDVEAAAVGRIDVLFRRDGLNGLLTAPFVPGIEVAGRVRELGDSVTGLTPGQRVVTLSNPGTGGYAQVAKVPASLVIPLDGIPGATVPSDIAVANVPNVVTAIAVLEDAARMQPGDDALVLGASGGLGGAFPMVAQSLGAGSVIGVVGSATSVPAAQARGFDEVLTADQVAGSNARFQVIIDPVGGPIRERALSLLRPLGRMVVVGNASGAEQLLIGTNDLWIGNAGVVGLNIAGLLAAEPERIPGLAARALDVLSNEDARLPVEVLPLAEAAEAHRRLESRSVAGRVVLAP
ncbi:quinone oxidoreductase family protein [Humibacter albus]|uniref:quinone oxidoreductase family protein n=1 Tax=Humibacter albus TaxID=427754 RepID=UPI00041EBE76|nr:zinc-binding dehydrogenase [Humibacter albus]